MSARSGLARKNPPGPMWCHFKHVFHGLNKSKIIFKKTHERSQNLNSPKMSAMAGFVGEPQKKTGPIWSKFQANFSLDQKHVRNYDFLPIFLGGPMGLFTRFGVMCWCHLVLQKFNPILVDMPQHLLVQMAKARPGPDLGNLGTWKSRKLESQKI